jgi:hypothetical protein
MQHRFFLALVVVGACGKGGGARGGVDRDAFRTLSAGIHGGDAWASASAAADKLLGPAKIKTDTKWTWAVDDGSDCYQLVLYKDGDKVGGRSSDTASSMAGRPYDKCAAHAKGQP